MDLTQHDWVQNDPMSKLNEMHKAAADKVEEAAEYLEEINYHAEAAVLRDIAAEARA